MIGVLFLAMKLKYHRLKPVVSRDVRGTVSSYEVEVPPAKAWWCPEMFGVLFLAMKLKYHRLKPGGVPRCSGYCF